MTATQVRELNDFLRALERYAGQLSTSGSTTQSIDAAQSGARELSKAFDSARDEYERLVDFPADNDVAAEKEKEELRKRIDRLWNHYDTVKQSMLHVGDDLLRTAAAESASASQLAKQCKQLSYTLYILGTLIILYGRAKSVFGAKKTHVD